MRTAASVRVLVLYYSRNWVQKYEYEYWYADAMLVKPTIEYEKYILHVPYLYCTRTEYG